MSETLPMMSYSPCALVDTSQYFLAGKFTVRVYSSLSTNKTKPAQRFNVTKRTENKIRTIAGTNRCMSSVAPIRPKSQKSKPPVFKQSYVVRSSSRLEPFGPQVLNLMSSTGHFENVFFSRCKTFFITICCERETAIAIIIFKRVITQS